MPLTHTVHPLSVHLLQMPSLLNSHGHQNLQSCDTDFMVIYLCFSSLSTRTLCAPQSACMKNDKKG